MREHPYIIMNGKIIERRDFYLSPDSDWIHFAPGFYDSLKVSNRKIYLWDYHYDRMKAGAAYWNLEMPEEKKLISLLNTFIEGSSFSSGKLRIQFCMKTSGPGSDYLITFEERPAGFEWNSAGWKAGLYTEHFKMADRDANIKNNRRDVYLMAMRWKNMNNFDDALVINQQGRVADSTICNVFWVEGDKIFTPPLHEAIVGGVMRRHILESQDKWGIRIFEAEALPARLEKADEIFLTNALRGVVPVTSFRDSTYRTTVGKAVFDKLKAWETEQYS